MQIMLILIFGGLGGISRFLLSEAIPNVLGFPIGTLVINIIGSFCLPIWNNGFGLKFSKKWLVAIGTGFIGAFTTFSGMILDIVKMQIINNYSGVIIYIILSIILGLLATIVGTNLAQRFNKEVKK